MRLKGQALVEFALALPIFLLLCFGLIDLSRYYFTEQSISHTLRAAARYAVTGQLMSNTNYNPTNGSLPYLTRRESIIATAQANNPASLDISANPTNYSTNDTFTIMSSTNPIGPWLTNSSSGRGGNYIRLTLTHPFIFLTPMLNLFTTTLNQGTPLTIQGSLMMKNEQFETNAYGNATNYWN